MRESWSSHFPHQWLREKLQDVGGEGADGFARADGIWVHKSVDFIERGCRTAGPIYLGLQEFPGYVNLRHNVAEFAHRKARVLVTIERHMAVAGQFLRTFRSE